MPVQHSEQCRPSPAEAGCSTVLLSSLGREGERIKRAGGRAEMPLGQMQIDGSDLEVAMAEQDLNGAQVGAGFEKVCGWMRLLSRPARSAAIWQALHRTLVVTG